MSAERRDGRRDRREEWKMRWEARMERGHRHGHIWTGVLLLLIGSVALMRSYVPDFPRWVFTWQMLLITLGLFIGFRHRFYGITWFILLLVGGTFLVNDYFIDGGLRKNLWPLILIAIGLFFIFRSRVGGGRHCFEKKNSDGKQGSDVNDGDDDADDPFIEVRSERKTSTSQEDYIDTTSIFGGTKKIILSKNFKGGDIVNVFGGTELNLTQADINEVAVLELTTIFGGTKLVIPSNWAVKSEAVTIFGGIEDKRHMPSTRSEHPEKTLVLRGTVIFGGIDIKSF